MEHKSMMLMFIGLLILNTCNNCKGFSLYPSDYGGGGNGDPAPGRSPGPPIVEQNNELASAEKKDISADIETSRCEIPVTSESDIDDHGDLSVSLWHRLFKTSELISGIVYEVVITRKRPGSAIDFSISSDIEGKLSGEFRSFQSFDCEPQAFRGRLEDAESEIRLNWSYQYYKVDGKSNITFRLNHAPEEDPYVYTLIYSIPILPDCQLELRQEEGVVTNWDLPKQISCQVWFPSREKGHGLVVELSRLNVPCSRGFLHLSGLNSTQHLHNDKEFAHRQAHLCGKLEELSETDRHIYFPSSHIHPFMLVQGDPVFTIAYHLVDYCYNLTFTTKNGSFELKETGDLTCTFKIFLPYGNRVAMKLKIGDTRSTGLPDMPLNFQDFKNGKSHCVGLLIQLQDGSSSWEHCTKPGDALRQIDIISRENRVVLKVRVGGVEDGSVDMNFAFVLEMSYRAEPIENVIGVCEFGWVVLRQFCVTAVETSRLSWAQAENECARRGGHLASIRSEHDQQVLHNLLVNSPGYRDHNAYWIGASDKTNEGDFRWSDGLPFSYTNWFPGWEQHNHYNRQPNDDGLSEQDCVEVRRVYALPAALGPHLATANAFAWNDRDCSTPNFFICERLQTDEPLEDSWLLGCNKTVILSRDQTRASVSSPGFPRQYPDNANCDIDIVASAGYRIILDFEELVLENEPSCSYDYLIILETRMNDSSWNNSYTTRRLCGDWSSKLKLLRHVSHGSRLKLRFSSDYSHHFGGFKARVSMESAMQCADDRFSMFNNSCYLIVSYPEVTWNTSSQICEGMKATLASVLSPEEERFITTSIRRATEYRTSAIYWLGAIEGHHGGTYHWIDGSAMTFRGWVTDRAPTENDVIAEVLDDRECLSIQWTTSPSAMLPSGLYWKSHRCDAIGGYICKRPNQFQNSRINHNKTLNGTEGSFSTPNYPGHYYHNLDFWVRIIGPEKTRIIIKFHKIDVESQIECLYDYVELKSISKERRKFSDAIKLCGSHDKEMNRFNFVSETNEAEIRFHSDYSISGKGFQLHWYAVDVSACPVQTLTAKEGTITTPNYPDFILSHLDCTITILAPSGKRIWLEFSHDQTFSGKIEEKSDISLELMLGKHNSIFKPFVKEKLLTEGTFITADEKLRLRIQTGDNPVGRGFSATYKITNPVIERKIITLTNSTNGLLLYLNFPDNPPVYVDFLQNFIAPLGCQVSLELNNVKLADNECMSLNKGVIEVYDSYSDTNGTTWKLCYDSDSEKASIPSTPIYISSFLNTLHLRQRHGSTGILFNGSLRVQTDVNYKHKLVNYKEREVESCLPNPCQNGGKCIVKKTNRFCQCTGHYTGLFCVLTKCELDPCAFGTCELTDTSYKCHCRAGYTGAACDQKRRPCEGNPCESRGTCVEKGESFQCRCHAWWEGQRCERRMTHIPYKPLSERMLHEPFWLGLMTVFVVMAVIGLVWCAKRHFPEKIEKLLAEEDSRNRISSLRSASVRDQLAAAAAAAASSSGGGATASSSPAPGSSAPRSLFGRLGIRKPSILSLTSPHAVHQGYRPPAATARTFSLDDLLKPPPRRTPSPKKKRNNSTPTKKNIAEKKQILQQLISPINRQNSRKVSLGELIHLSDITNKDLGDSDQNLGKLAETQFDGNTAQSVLNDPKLEKKVTFARLLNKVSAEMSSGSDIEMGIMQSNRLGCMFARPSSTPPSPGIDMRSPNSTSSNQGSDSFTSSELAIPSALSSSISDLLIHRRHNRLPNGRPKPASADSILAMFRNFSSSSAGVNLPSSLRISPSTTPTASSPQDDLVGDDDSSTSSIHTPVSLCSLPSESPILQRRASTQGTIEVPVLDALSAHKSNSGGSNLLHPPTILLEIPSTINKCLSPIREMPTPLPSPALTPIMRRSAATSSSSVQQDDAEFSDDGISVEIPNISFSCSEDDEVHRSDIVIDPQAEDGFILEDAAVMQNSASLRAKNRPPPIGQLSDKVTNEITISIAPPPLVIPTLTIQTPSPTYSTIPSIVFPGSPPPSRKSNDTCFPFPSPKPARKMLKDFDKPTSLDLPGAPPLITITCNMSEIDSDTESPAVKSTGTVGGMTYLSPCSMNTRGDHNTSESNLSSSGYSSMASPGPSRCGSSNPLCPSEMEDQGPHGSSGGHRRQSTPVLKSNASSLASKTMEKNTQQQQRRGRSDSETLSDDPHLESNDEGIGTDHIDEKIDDGEVKSAKELEVFMVNENENCKTLLDLPVPIVTSPKVVKCLSLEDAVDRLLPPVTSNKNYLQLPSIVVQCDSPCCEKYLSPMSSRSESPLSDQTSSMGRFSPQFYGRHKDLLPFTDSDGLYDFPSSDKVNVPTCTHHKKSNRKREKKLVRSGKALSPTKSQPHTLLYSHLDIPSKDTLYKVPPPRKLSPKRRVTRSQVVSSSSSSDSIISTRDQKHSSSSPSPDTIRWSSPVAWKGCSRSLDGSAEEANNDDKESPPLAKSVDLKNHYTNHQKVSRLRAISHQIRFLKRLEQSLKKRERTVSPSDSPLDSGEESPGATSPLLHCRGPKTEIKKSNSIGKLQSGTTPPTTKFSKRGGYRKSEMLLPQEQSSLRVVLTGTGYSD